MSKKITLKVCKKSWDNYPLEDENGEIIHRTTLEKYLSNQLIVDLSSWQQDYEEGTNYNEWAFNSKVDFERQGLALAVALAASLPRGIKFSYFSELYQQEIEA
jgi:hypothetical protein